MSDRKYTLPGMPDWNFKVSLYDSPMLWHKGGAGFSVTADTSAQEIAAGIKNILRQTTSTPDEVVFELIAQAARNIDWQTMLKPLPVLVAPLLNAGPAATQQAIPPEQFDKIYGNLEAGYYAIKAFDPRGKNA